MMNIAAGNVRGTAMAEKTAKQGEAWPAHGQKTCELPVLA